MIYVYLSYLFVKPKNVNQLLSQAIKQSNIEATKYITTNFKYNNNFIINILRHKERYEQISDDMINLLEQLTI